MSGLDADWGPVTPEGYDDSKHEALHVLNVNFIDEDNRNRATSFVVARVLYSNRHLPNASSHRISFDLRGQLISNKSLDHARQTIIKAVASQQISVSVEFLTN